MERVQTPAGVKRVFNQVAREMGLGACVDAQDSEEIRRLEPLSTCRWRGLDSDVGKSLITILCIQLKLV